MARRIYLTLFLMTFAGGVILYYMMERIAPNALLATLIVLSMLMITGIHGLVAHTINPKLKGGLIGYPLFMGILFAILLFIFVFYIMPLYYPDFLNR